MDDGSDHIQRNVQSSDVDSADVPRCVAPGTVMIFRIFAFQVMNRQSSKARKAQYTVSAEGMQTDYDVRSKGSFTGPHMTSQETLHST